MKTQVLTNLVNQFSEDLYKWAYRKTSSAETANKLVQDTFFGCRRKKGHFKGDSPAKT